MAELQSLIDVKQREIDNLKANHRIERTVHRFQLVHNYGQGSNLK